MTGRNNDELINATEIALADKYNAKYKKRKSTVIVKDTVKFLLPDKQSIKLFFRNGKLIKGESKDLTREQVNEIVDYLKEKFK